MLTRRSLLAASTALAATALLVRVAPAAFVPPALAQSPPQAAGFIEQTARQLTQVVNGGAPTAQKQAEMQQIIDRSVDVDDVGRFCLGRFWRAATPQQQHEYLELFHRVLMLNITSKVGDYQGVNFTMDRAAPREADVAVTTMVNRPNNAPTRVDWIVSSASGAPKIVDVVAEGTSLRLTQRSDYASYLAHHGNDVQSLIDALKQQAGARPS